MANKKVNTIDNFDTEVFKVFKSIRDGNKRPDTVAIYAHIVGN